MRKTFDDKLEAGRIRTGFYATSRGDTFGQFMVQGPCGMVLGIMAYDGEGPESERWEHVSVSTAKRVPNWQEMCFVKDLFWGDEECVVQFHPPRSEYVNNNPNVLHLWRHKDGHVTPPSILVGVKSRGILTPAESRDLARQIHGVAGDA